MRPRRSSNWKQSILLGGSFFLACFVGYLLWRDYQEDAAIGRGATAVAQIRTSEGDVRRRPGDRFRWFKIGLNKRLFVSDSLHTGEKARAELAFLDGTILTVTENTLFTVERRSQGTVAIQLASGQVSFKRSSVKRWGTQAAPPRIEAHGKTLNIAEAEGRIAVSDRHVALEVDRGKASLEQGVRIETVNAGKGLEAKIDGSMQIADLPHEPPPLPSPSPSPSGTAPVANVTVPLPSSRIAPDPLEEYTPNEADLKAGPLDLELTWDPVSDARGYEIVLSAEPDFSGPLERVESGATSTILQGKDFGSRRLHYRLVARFEHGAEASSPVGVIDFRFRGPMLAAPSDNLAIEVSSPVIFTWSQIPGIHWYFLELSRDPAFKQGGQKAFANTNFYIFSAPAPGNYWWRVRAVRNSTISDSARTHRLTVKR